MRRNALWKSQVVTPKGAQVGLPVMNWDQYRLLIWKTHIVTVNHHSYFFKELISLTLNVRPHCGNRIKTHTLFEQWWCCDGRHRKNTLAHAQNGRMDSIISWPLSVWIISRWMRQQTEFPLLGSSTWPEWTSACWYILHHVGEISDTTVSGLQFHCDTLHTDICLMMSPVTQGQMKSHLLFIW